MMSDSSSIFISAGDPSADYPGKNLIDELRRLCPEIDIFGLGGPLMQEAGLRPLADHEGLAVMGFREVLPRILYFRRLLHNIEDEIKRRRPKAVILIDYPGFNLRLAARIKPLGIPIIYYISPQVWAWGKRRLKDIRQLVDLMLVIFPFEESFYREQGVTAHFTGHPIVDRYRNIPDKSTCRDMVGHDDDRKLIALLPGSRMQEIKRMLPTMVKASILIKKESDKIDFIVAGVGNVDPQVYRDIIRQQNIAVIAGKTPELINGADFVITSSGTATIETAYFMTPMLIIYKTGFLTYHIARSLIDLDSIGMVNIVAGRKVVPELIQNNASPEAIASHTLEIMGSPELYGHMVEDLEAVRNKLGTKKAGVRAAELIQEVFSLC
jgi:lipid-A-disaccharide synthase